MIVPMHKVTLLCPEADRAGALEALRELGVLHLSWEERRDQLDIEGARKRLTQVRRAIELLPKVHEGKPSGQPAEGVVAALLRIRKRRREIGEELEGLGREMRHIEPFGSFCPQAVASLAARSLSVRLFQAPPKHSPAIPADTLYLETRRTETGVWFALLGWGIPPAIDAQEVPLPSLSLATLRQHQADLEAELAALARQTAQFAGDRVALARLEAAAEDALQLAEARAALGSATPSLAYLQGFSPATEAERIRDLVKGQGWGLVLDEPDEEDRVPTLIRNPRWLKPIEAVFDLIGILPGYREIDVSLWFLLFFSLFFAMLVGDAGYGAIFLGLTLWAQRRFPQVAPHVFTLLKITSIGTMAWGVLTGTYFGIPNLPAPLSALKIDWLGDEDHVKELCFWIAAVHLSIAHVWNIARMIRTPQALAQLGWLCVVWFMFFGARSVVLNLPFPPLMPWVFGAGVLLIVLFMTPMRDFKNEWFNHVMLPLNLVSSFVDVISYIRLYAVGTASYAIASTFNGMLAPLFDGWLSGAFAALLLFLAHGVNIILSVMGVMVHGIRLNTLEFASHAGLQWSGIPYRPLRRRVPAA